MMPADREAKVAAKKFRQQHNLGNQPLGDLAELIQRTTGHDGCSLRCALLRYWSDHV
ncbi:hypothetical protein CFELI_01915 [Corynebacterium felinum]|uniref:Uncharacterized protein n=1 Tax=Corynebacterium felinum TaxID=131318 RepID=A0ABU2B7R7_9CORY|nr:hypothetical protein [Corynebacterium felinum]WJY94026.1 hypothetical protein CFELI_01915 [Corynebacterium felinum]